MLSPSQGYPQHFAGTHLYTWVERGTKGVKCLAQEHNTMSPARSRTRTIRSEVEHTNHEATATPTLKSYNCRHIIMQDNCHLSDNVSAVECRRISFLSPSLGFELIGRTSELQQFEFGVDEALAEILADDDSNFEGGFLNMAGGDSSREESEDETDDNCGELRNESNRNDDNTRLLMLISRVYQFHLTVFK